LDCFGLLLDGHRFRQIIFKYKLKLIINR